MIKKKKIKRINNTGLFSEPSLIIFTKGTNNSDHVCIYLSIYIYIYTHTRVCVSVSVCVCVCVHLYLHNKYTEYTHIYYVNINFYFGCH